MQNKVQLEHKESINFRVLPTFSFTQTVSCSMITAFFFSTHPLTEPFHGHQQDQIRDHPMQTPEQPWASSSFVIEHQHAQPAQMPTAATSETTRTFACLSQHSKGQFQCNIGKHKLHSQTTDQCLWAVVCVKFFSGCMC